MNIFRSKQGRTERFNINNHESIIEYAFESRSKSPMSKDKMAEAYGWIISYEENSVVLKTHLDLNEHIIGLGEKAFNIDRRGFKFQMWNYDNDGYSRYDDPLYLSIPFYISINNGSVKGIFVNSTAKIMFDFGVEDYEHTTIQIDDKSLDLYLFEGESVEQVVEEYTTLTGRSLSIPEWALGPHISRYSYYPDTRVLEVVDEYRKYMPVSAIHLDIDYMEDYKLFTWNRERFPDPENMIRNLHEKGVKLITILDPSFKVDQNYRAFVEGMGKYISTPKNEIYTGKMWPGKSSFLDFPSEDAENYWGKLITKLVNTGVDGIWLDMNEPTVLEGSKVIGEENIHVSTGKTHGKVA
jgi:Alpha-glucosidases, family 31 of glycosyl hydrolases